MFTNPPDPLHLPKCSSASASVLQNVTQGIVLKSKFAAQKSSIGTYDKERSSVVQMSQRCHHEPSSAAAASSQWLQVASPGTFGSPASFQQRCGVVTTSETIQKLASSATWKFNPPPSGAPQHHLGSMVIDVLEKKQQIKLEVHKETVGQIVSV